MKLTPEQMQEWLKTDLKAIPGIQIQAPYGVILQFWHHPDQITTNLILAIHGDHIGWSLFTRLTDHKTKTMKNTIKAYVKP
jgi:hypothetical protein